MNALNKYTMDSFSLFILEITDKNKVIEREQFYFEKYNPEYNILKKAASILGLKHSPETRAKMSENAKNRTKDPNPAFKVEVLD
jgi:group I intron endonuclease